MWFFIIVNDDHKVQFFCFSTRSINEKNFTPWSKMAEQIFESTYVQLKGRIKDVEITPQTIITVLRVAMETVEFTQLKGEAQRGLAVRLVRRAVEDAPVSDDKEKLLLDMIDNGILDNTIDLVVAATQGQIDVNTAIACATACCNLLKRQRG